MFHWLNFFKEKRETKKLNTNLQMSTDLNEENPPSQNSWIKKKENLIASINIPRSANVFFAARGCAFSGRLRRKRAIFCLCWCEIGRIAHTTFDIRDIIGKNDYPASRVCSPLIIRFSLPLEQFKSSIDWYVIERSTLDGHSKPNYSDKRKTTTATGIGTITLESKSRFRDAEARDNFALVSTAISPPIDPFFSFREWSRIFRFRVGDESEFSIFDVAEVGFEFVGSENEKRCFRIVIVYFL